MANIVTNTEVFEFMKTQADVITNEGTMITNLITLTQDTIEKQMTRYIHSKTVTDLILHNGLNCEIFEEKLFLRGYFRDLYSISAITEDGNSLSAVTAYNDGNDYYLDARKGILIRNEQNWSLQPFALKITGKLGMVNQSDDSAMNGWKKVLIEYVAIKSGLWKENIVTEGGTINRSRTTVSKSVEDFISLYALKPV